MTLYGWDASHYDGTLSTAILARAKAEGIAFFTHKIGEGTNYDDPNDATALGCAKAAGIEFIGGYFVPRSAPAVADQVTYLLNLADRDEPWWRGYPGWFWQVDLERWSYDNVPASVGIAFAQELQRRTGRFTILYASNGQYNGGLTGWGGPLWNAHYTSATAGTFTAMYPGDNWRPTMGSTFGGWGAYSGREPAILQYTSSATIAGLGTCDANAYRGSVAQLRALIEGEDMLDGYVAAYPDHVSRPEGLALSEVVSSALFGVTVGGGATAIGRIEAYLVNLTAVVQALAVGGVDVDALVARITAGVIAGHDTLTLLDEPVIQAAVLNALRAGTNS